MTNPHMANNAVFGMVGSGGVGGFGGGLGGGFGGGFGGGGLMQQQLMQQMMQLQMEQQQQQQSFQTLANTFNAPAGNPVDMAAAAFATAPVILPTPAPAANANQTVADFLKTPAFQQFASTLNGQNNNAGVNHENNLPPLNEGV
jgi:hypothetical protein